MILVEETCKQIHTAEYYTFDKKIHIEYIRDTKEEIVNFSGWERVPERN